MRAYIGVSIDQMSFKWFMVVVFLHIASELVDVGWFSPLGLCHCYLNTIVGSHKSFLFFSMTSWVEVARPIKDHMNHFIFSESFYSRLLNVVLARKVYICIIIVSGRLCSGDNCGKCFPFLLTWVASFPGSPR